MFDTPGFADAKGIANMSQFVWGNARQSGGVITCQHGAEECLMNTAQNCIINLAAGNVSQWLPTIKCLEVDGVNQQKVLKKCVEANGYVYADINTCWKGAQGKALDQAA